MSETFLILLSAFPWKQLKNDSRFSYAFFFGKKFFVYQYCPYILLSDIIRFRMFLFAYVNLNCLFPTHQFRWLKRSSISSACVLLTQLWATKQNTRWFDIWVVFYDGRDINFPSFQWIRKDVMVNSALILYFNLLQSFYYVSESILHNISI